MRGRAAVGAGAALEDLGKRLHARLPQGEFLAADAARGRSAPMRTFCYCAYIGDHAVAAAWSYESLFA
ncbi:hypothetical protein ACOXH8_05785 [Nannocystis pusilla]